MLKTKYIPQENADLMLRILEKVKANYENVIFNLKATDGETDFWTTFPESIVDGMDGIDCEGFGVNCYHGDYRKYLGWFFFTPYEDDTDCVLCDMTDNDFCKEMSNE